MDAVDEYAAMRLKVGQECLAEALWMIGHGLPALALCPAGHYGSGPGHRSRDCDAPGKRPWYPWKQYQDRLPADDEVRSWWGRMPTANVGLALGNLTRLVSIDEDGPAGCEMLAELSGGQLPPTWEFVTPGGGYRRLYRVPEGVRIRTTIHQARGVHEELRFQGHGAQTVVPPSLHTDTERRYEWVSGRSWYDRDCAPAPDWLIDQVKDNRTDRKRDAQFKVEPGEVIQDGRRGEVLFRMASAMRGRGMEPDEILPSLQVVNQRCDPPVDAGRLEQIARGVGRYPVNPVDPLLLNPPRIVHSNGRTPNPATGRGDEESPPEPETAEAILKMEFPEAPCVVADLVPIGLTVLAGRPKQGKSWLALQLSIAVVQGGSFLGKHTVGGDVLYLALEDHRRRIQHRLRHLLGAGDAPPGLERLSFLFSEVGPGDFRPVAAWLERAVRPVLLVVDTLGRFMPQSRRDGDSYTADYAFMAQVKQMVECHNCAALVVHHTRKATADDPLTEVSGSTAFTGAADAVLVLRRNRREEDATLTTTGRDFNEEEINIQWKDGLWSLGGAGHVINSAREPGRRGPDPVRLQECCDWLRKWLTQDRLLSLTISTAEMDGYNKNLVYRSIEALGVRREDRGTRKWLLALSSPTPENRPHLYRGEGGTSSQSDT